MQATLKTAKLVRVDNTYRSGRVLVAKVRERFPLLLSG